MFDLKVFDPVVNTTHKKTNLQSWPLIQYIDSALELFFQSLMRCRLYKINKWF